MYNPILITTTNSIEIENASVERYIELISVNVVVGTNIFSDIGASFSDFFGGLSGNYQKKLEGIYKNGIDNLKRKAIDIGANAILGVKTDFDEISGKGKSMFMLSISGTAVRLKYNKAVQINKQIKNTISSDILEIEVSKRLIKNKIKQKGFPNEKDWIFLLNYPIEESTEDLLDIYLKVDSKREIDKYEKEKLFTKNFANYITILHKENLENILYKRLEINEPLILSLLKRVKLFSPHKIIDLINNKKKHTAIKCLKIAKSNYSNEDLKLMQEIVYLLDNLKDLGKVEAVKGFIGKEKEKYICPNGHKNSVDVKYCQHIGNYECGLNIKGLSEKEVHEIKLFRIKVESLNSILNGNK